MSATARWWIGGLFAAFCTAAAAADAPGVPIDQLAPLRPGPSAKGIHAASDAKIEPRMLGAIELLTGAPAGAAAQAPSPGVASFIRQNVESDQTIFSVIRATVTPELVAALRAAGARDISEFPEYDRVTANLPVAAIRGLAQRAEVRSIGPRERMRTNRFVPAPDDPLAAMTEALTPPLAKVGTVNWQGVVAHQASVVQAAGITGAGVKVCVVSDGVDSLSSRIASGDLPPDTAVLPGQAGSGDEGTAMLEIVHDMAPGASLMFATANPSAGQMASNIVSLRNAGCDIIVDDISYLQEGAFQDDVVAQAVNQVTASGAVYLSAAANSGNLAHGSSGTYEGDFVAYPGVPTRIGQLWCGSDATCLSRIRLQSFNGAPYATLTLSTDIIGVQWADPLSGTANDYDIAVLDSTDSNLLCYPGAGPQTGTQQAIEFAFCDGTNPSDGSPGGLTRFPAGSHIYVVKFAGNARPIRLDTFRGRISGGTNGSTFAHNAAASAITVGAVDVRTAGGGVFTTSNQVTYYSSDGPRKMFFTPAGAEITPGNSFFATNGGITIAKVDIAASDCGSTTTPGFTPFCGTSAAAPSAAAIAALVKSANPGATRADIANALAAGALDIEAAGRDVAAGNGIVMAPAAVRAVLQPLTVTRGFSASPATLGQVINFITRVTNANAVAITGVGLAVAFPSSSASPAGALAVAGAGCTGTKVDAANGFTLSAATIPANTTCTYTVPVTVGRIGSFSTGTNAVTSAIGLASTAPGATLTVSPMAPVMTASATPNPAPYGSPVTITATIAGAAAAGVPTGTVTFSGPNGALCTAMPVSLVSGTTVSAQCTTSSLGGGPDHVTAAYSGDSGYAAASAIADVLVTISTTVTVTSSAPSSLNGQTVTFTAIPSGTVGLPSGTVQFRSDGSVINGCAASAIVLGAARCSTGALAPGSHTVSAVYSGSADGTFLGSTGTMTQSVDTATPPPPAPGSGKRFDFNGDGTSDLAWQLADGSVSVWLMSGNVTIGRGIVLGAAPGSVTKTADFNGDGKADLVRSFADGSATMWLMNGIDAVASAPLRGAGSGWHLANVGDFNGDGKADLLWRNDDGSVQVWLMDGTTTLSSTTIMGPNPYWTPAKVGDFNGDGKTDILWVNVDGTTSMWLMDGAARTSGGTVMPAGTGWRPTHVADFNGDGKSDILWRHDGDGAVSMWLMNGLAIADRGSIMPGNSGWSVMQVGRLDGDASADIIWLNADGTVSAWIMQGRTVLRRGQLMPAGSGWTVAQVVDTNGDGSGDLVWTHKSGNVGLWTIDWTATVNSAFAVLSRTPLLNAGNPWMPATSLEQNR